MYRDTDFSEKNGCAATGKYSQKYVAQCFWIVNVLGQ